MSRSSSLESPFPYRRLRSRAALFAGIVAAVVVVGVLLSGATLSVVAPNRSRVASDSPVLSEASMDAGIADAAVSHVAVKRMRDRARTREALRLRILEQRKHRGEPSTDAVRHEEGAPLPFDAPGSLEKDVIRSEVRENITPLLEECYDLIGYPKPKGKIVVRFTVVGEPDVGSVVVDAVLDEELTSTALMGGHPLTECVLNSLYAVELPAPENGNMVRIRYPFIFLPDSDAGLDDLL